jgi:hypothetical protein
MKDLSSLSNHSILEINETAYVRNHHRYELGFRVRRITISEHPEELIRLQKDS